MAVAGSINRVFITVVFPSKLPMDYGTPDTDKAVVLPTDRGLKCWYDYSKPPTGDYTAYGRLSKSRLEIPQSMSRPAAFSDWSIARNS